MKWGEWIRLRATFVGLNSQKELADATHVNPKVVSNWYQMDVPLRIRSTSFEALAAALGTHPEIIRRGYVDCDPTRAPNAEEYESATFDTARRSLMTLAHEQGFVELANEYAEAEIREKINDLVDLLHYDALLRVIQLCRQLYRESDARFDQHLEEAGEVFDAALKRDAERWTEIVNAQKEELMARLAKERKRD